MTTINARPEVSNGDAMHLMQLGLPNPITDFQRPENDKAQDQGAQAGGFWRKRRQWRKAL
ncbi:hypothetical protein [Pseudomonas sp. GM60]|uniref:hypothetical protein n=1 Tax=Pseudomonas sp. GM60 TaxID=1144334 RepID=UPI0012FAC709|nr:hypothetical protein [Pseudomonas sp. GM60]